MTENYPAAERHFETLLREPLSAQAQLAVAALRRIIAEQADAIAEKDRQIQEANERADTDALTGLYNRGAFDADLALLAQELSFDHNHRELDPHRQFKWMLILGDLDYFKLVNDVLGYEFGDTTLVSIAELLKQSMRHSDKIYRLGGDEFAAIVPVVPGEEDAAFQAITERFYYHLDQRRDNGDNTPEVEALEAVGISFAHGILPDAPSSVDDFYETMAATMWRVKETKTAKGTDLR